MKPLTAGTVCNASLAALMLLLMQSINVLPIWPMVIAWACFFHLGGGEEPLAAMAATLLSTIFGVVMGWLAAIAILSNPVEAFIPNSLWAPIIVGIAVGAISVSAYWKPLSITPVCIYGFAANWGYLDVLGHFNLHLLTSLDMKNVILALPGAIVLGGLFGYVNAKLIGQLVSKQYVAHRLSLEQQE